MSEVDVKAIRARAETRRLNAGLVGHFDESAHEVVQLCARIEALHAELVESNRLWNEKVAEAYAERDAARAATLTADVLGDLVKLLDWMIKAHVGPANMGYSRLVEIRDAAQKARGTRPQIIDESPCERGLRGECEVCEQVALKMRGTR